MDETSGDLHSIHMNRRSLPYTLHVPLSIVNVGRVCMPVAHTQIQCLRYIDLSRSVPLRFDFIASHPHEIVR